MAPSELLTRWSVRLALALYVAALAVWLTDRARRRDALARWLYTLGAAAMLLHVGLAFHFFHGWSHAHAYRETARQTAELTGIDWGGGLWLNYLFVLLWTADAARRWRPARGRESFRVDDPGSSSTSMRKDSRPLPLLLSIPLHAYLLFIAVNATIVFETGPTRWFAVTALLLLAILWAANRHANPKR